MSDWIAKKSEVESIERRLGTFSPTDPCWDGNEPYWDGRLSSAHATIAQCSSCRIRYERAEPAPSPSAAPATEPGRCTACGSRRIPLNRAETVFGACGLVPGRDGTGGCPDPLHDYSAEQSPAPASPRPEEPARQLDPRDGSCCDCGYTGEDETPCLKRTDGTHCEHWYDGTVRVIASDAPAPSPSPGATTPLTEERIAELERLAAEATPGPWEFSGGLGGTVTNWPGSEQPDALIEILSNIDEENHWDIDGQFIVAARNDLPAILAELRSLRRLRADEEGRERRRTPVADEIERSIPVDPALPISDSFRRGLNTAVRIAREFERAAPSPSLPDAPLPDGRDATREAEVGTGSGGQQRVCGRCFTAYWGGPVHTNCSAAPRATDDNGKENVTP